MKSVPWALAVGPLGATAAVALWTAMVSPHTRYGDNWAVYPVLVAFLGVLGIHALLLVRSRFRIAMGAYAIVHIAF